MNTNMFTLSMLSLVNFTDASIVWQVTIKGGLLFHAPEDMQSHALIAEHTSPSYVTVGSVC